MEVQPTCNNRTEADTVALDTISKSISAGSVSRGVEFGVAVPDAEAIAPEVRFRLEADLELSIFLHEAARG